VHKGELIHQWQPLVNVLLHALGDGAWNARSSVNQQQC
jgi:hypothetical protein